MPEAWALVEDGAVIDSHDAHRIVPWWSFTKTVLAAAALVLVRGGIAALDEPVDGKPYTLRHLLQHRSGLVNYGGLPAYHEAVDRGDDPWPATVLLDKLDAGRLRYAPGEGWAYSNIGYLRVRQLIEGLTGDTLDGALRRLVLTPLGIRNAGIAFEREGLDHVEMGSARGYHPAWVYHGLLVGSVTDAALLLDRLMNGQLLPASHLGEMLKRHALPGPVPDRSWAAPGYGLGLMSGEAIGGLKVAGHTGGGPGSTIAVYRAFDRKPDRTAACFITSADQAKTEEKAFALLSG